jgi:hypothetical protein
LWERARVRGAFQPKTPLIRPSGTFSHKGRRIKFDLCNNVLSKKKINSRRSYATY